MVMKTSTITDKTANSKVAQILAQGLADTYITYLKTQNFHWNLVDPRFHSLHLMFEKNYQELAEAVDEIAERIRMIGAKSPATMREFLELTSLEEGEENLSGDAMIQALCQDRDTISEHYRRQIEEVIKQGDQGSADLLIQHLRMHEKAAWMLRSHLGNNI